MKPASRRKRIIVNAHFGHFGIIELVPGSLPYLWIGAKKGFFYGTVSDGDVKRLRDFCSEILERRKLEKSQ